MNRPTNTRWSRLSFAARIAKRYLLAKKSHNAINIISGISVLGVMVGTTALVIVLSIFNGFGVLFTNLFSAFDPELKITINEGKIFNVEIDELQKVKKHPKVAVFSEVVEENALLKFNEKQMPAMIKGVDEADFKMMTRIDSILFDGEFLLYDGAFHRAVPGLGIASVLGLGAHFIDPLFIYAPKRTSRINLLRPQGSFNESPTFVSGIFSVQQNDYDNHYVLVSLDLARELFEYDENQVSSVELQLLPGSDLKKAQKEFQQLLGNDFLIQNRHEQQEGYFRIMRIEKWITYLILSFILLIASFNVVGSLSMLIIDKKNDILTLRSLGADQRLIRLIFLLEGWMISITGAVLGILLGSAFSVLQEKFGIIRLGQGFIIDTYPSVTQFSDVFLVFITVLLMGFLAAWYPVHYMKNHSSRSIAQNAN